jgi:hypothetical protein
MTNNQEKPTATCGQLGCIFFLLSCVITTPIGVLIQWVFALPDKSDVLRTIYAVCSLLLILLLIRRYRIIDSPSVPLIEKQSRAIPKSVQHEVWRRDQARCTNCGSQDRLEFDHIIPFSKGGGNTARNIQLLCQQCNRSKSAANPGDY